MTQFSVVAVVAALCLVFSANGLEAESALRGSILNSLAASGSLSEGFLKKEGKDEFLVCDESNCHFGSVNRANWFVEESFEGQYRYKTSLNNKNNYYLDRISCHGSTSGARITTDGWHCGAKHWGTQSVRGDYFKIGEDQMKNCIANDGRIKHCYESDVATVKFSQCSELMGNVRGRWIFIVGSNEQIEHEITHTVSHSYTASVSSSWGKTITNQGTFGLDFGKVSLGLEHDSSTTSSLSHSLSAQLSQTETSSTSFTVPANQQLYQFELELEDECGTTTVATGISHVSTERPCCLPGYFDQSDITGKKCLPLSDGRIIREC